MNSPPVIATWLKCAPYLKSVLRIVAAFTFIQFGTMKLFSYPMAMPPGTMPGLMSQVGLAGIMETFGGVLVLLGIFTRPVAFLLAGEMAWAYFQGHAPNGFWTLANGGTDAVMYCFVWLYFSAAGGGPWSLDALRQPRAPGAEPARARSG